MKTFNKDFLRILIIDKNFSYQRLCNIFKNKYGKNITKSSISLWLKGKTKPNIDNLIILSEIFNVSLDSFFQE